MVQVKNSTRRSRADFAKGKLFTCKDVKDDSLQQNLGLRHYFDCVVTLFAFFRAQSQKKVFSYDIDIEFETVQSIEITGVELVQSTVEIMES